MANTCFPRQVISTGLLGLRTTQKTYTHSSYFQVSALTIGSSHTVFSCLLFLKLPHYTDNIKYSLSCREVKKRKRRIWEGEAYAPDPTSVSISKFHGK